MTTRYKIGLFILTITLLVIVALYCSNLNNETKTWTYIITGITAIILYLLLAATFPRHCKKCKIKMTRHYPKDSFIPDYYYCKSCNSKDYTHVYLGTDV